MPIQFVLEACAIGVVAQLGEHLPCTQGVGSSILPGSTKKQARDNVDESARGLHFGLYYQEVD